MTELKEIYNRITSLEDDSKQTLQIVTEIKMGICGSKRLGIEGISQKVDKHDKYIETDKKQKWMISGAVVVLMALWSILLAFKEKIFGNS